MNTYPRLASVQLPTEYHDIIACSRSRRGPDKSCEECGDIKAPEGLGFIGKQENSQGLPVYNLFQVLSGVAYGTTLAVAEGENVERHWHEVEKKFNGGAK